METDLIISDDVVKEAIIKKTNKKEIFETDSKCDWCNGARNKKSLRLFCDYHFNISKLK